MNHRTFCEKCNFQCDNKLNHKVLNCTLKAFALLVRNAVPNVTEALHLPSLKINGLDLSSFPNKLIQTLLTQDTFPNQASRNDVTQIFPESYINRFKTMCLSFPILLKAKEL